MMERIEHFLEGVGGGIVLLFGSFWVSLAVCIYVRLHRPEDRELFTAVSNFTTGFGTAFLTMMNSRSQKKTEVTGKNAEVTVNQGTQQETPPQKSL